MSDTTYSVEYDNSGRAKCKKCLEKIPKGNVRVTTTSPGGDYELKKHYHSSCFALPRRFRADGAEAFVEQEMTEESNDNDDDDDKDNATHSILEPGSAEREKLIKDIELATSQVGKKKKPKNDNDENGGSSFMARVKATAEKEMAHEKDQNDVKEPATKKVKTEETRSNSVINEEDEFRQFVEKYKEIHKMKVDNLKDYLRYNKTILKGKKEFILFKVADGMIHGRLARCPLDGGKLKFDEDDYETVHCGGKFDEDSQIRIPCAFEGKRTDTKLRVKPFYMEQPTEEELKAMEDEIAEPMSEFKKRADELGSNLLEAVKKADWDLTGAAGIRDATEEIVGIVEGELDLPEDRDSKRAIGKIVMQHKEKEPIEIMQEIIDKFGFKEVKEAKKEKKKEATKNICANPKNAPVVAAFSELAELYFKDKNTNAALSYKKAVKAMSEIEDEITADNALSFSKGKTKIPGIGKGSAEKMKEFCLSGTIAKLEEKRSLFA